MSSGRQGGSSALRAVERPESALLQKLKRGEMTLDEFLDARAEEALAPVMGKVTGERLEDLRMVLREKIRTDPLLVELVRQATGQIPQPLSDGEHN